VTTPDATLIQRAAALLNEGKVIAIPTDTVYGLAASLHHPAALEEIYAIKGREAGKALPVLLDGPDAIDRWAVNVPERAIVLAKAFWPGALTIVLDASPDVPEGVHRGAGTVGLRVPDSEIARAIIRAAGGGLAVTSANLSGRTEAKRAEEVRNALGDRLAMVVDGGPSSGGVPSTVVDLTGAELKILRAGAITPDDLDRALN
jgi:L-threonylcarbamoyladenylate synthase